MKTAFVLAFFLALGGGMQADTSTAQDFIESLYSRYAAAADEAPTEAQEESWRDDAVYTPRIVALFARLDELAGPDNVADHRDGDHICQCQDWGEFRVLSRTVRMIGEDRAEAQVRFTNFGDILSERLFLERTGAGWRVADVFYRGYERGLLRALEDSANRAERERRRR